MSKNKGNKPEPSNDVSSTVVGYLKHDFLNLIVPSVNTINPNLNPIRVENDFTRFSYLFHQFGLDGKLMFEVMSYLIYKFQYDVNLFSNENVQTVEGWSLIFDVTDFAKVYNYRKENLWRQHSDPAFNKYKSNVGLSNNSFFTSIIGNAIYRLYREKLDIRNHLGVSTMNHSIELIKKINNPDETRGSKGQYIVEILLDTEFVNSINRRYVLIAKNMLIELNKNKKNLAIPYTHFSFRSNYLANIKRSYWEYGFDEMCDILNIDIKNPKDAKKKIKQKIEEINKLSELDLKLEFFKSNETHNWEYDIRIHFLHNGINSKTEPFRNSALKDAVMLSFLMNLTPFYKANYSYQFHNNTDFINWIGNNKQHYEQKTSVFVSTYKSIVGKHPSKELVARFFTTPGEFILTSSVNSNILELEDPTK
jgi:hypothetical protein